MAFGKSKKPEKEEKKGLETSGTIALRRPSDMSSSSAPANQTVIGAGSNIDGTLRFDTDATINGSVDGGVISQALLRFGEQAKIKGNIQGTDIIFCGSLEGDISASEKLTLQKPARVTGNISAPSISIEEGVTFEGSCSMKEGGPQIQKIKTKIHQEKETRGSDSTNI